MQRPQRRLGKCKAHRLHVGPGGRAGRGDGGRQYAVGKESVLGNERSPQSSPASAESAGRDGPIYRHLFDGAVGHTRDTGTAPWWGLPRAQGQAPQRRRRARTRPPWSTRPPPTPRNATAVWTSPASRIVSTLINAVLSPFANSAPTAPVQSPAALTLLAFARRDFEQANFMPSTTVNPLAGQISNGLVTRRRRQHVGRHEFSG